MNPRSIPDADLLAFLAWYFKFRRGHVGNVVTLTISAAGHFHTTEKTAAALIRRAIAAGYVVRDGDAMKMASGKR